MILDFEWKIGDRCLFITVDQEGTEIKFPVKIINKDNEFYEIQGNFLEKYIVPVENKFYAHADELTFIPALEIIQ